MARQILIAGMTLAVIVLCWWLWALVPPPVAASPFDPPTQKQAQRIIGRAYERQLRPRHGSRAGIVTRCRGRRVVLCTVHVWKSGEHRYWQMTSLRLEKGSVRTLLDGELRGVIMVPRDGGGVVFYRSRPLRSP